MTKILITGAAGQLSWALQQQLPKGSFLALTHKEMDIENLDEVRRITKEYHPQIIINGAAYNQVDCAEDEPDKAYLVNETGPKNLAEAAREIHARIVHVSTDYVFDGEKSEPYCETDPVNPLNVYGKSKLAGEYAVLEKNPESYVVRTAWVYCEHGNNFYKKILDLARKQPYVSINSDQTGSPTYAPHLAEAILKMIKKEEYGLYHLAGSGTATRYEVTIELFKQLGLNTKIKPASSNDFPSKATRASYSAMKSTRQHKIELPHWKQGISEFAQALKQNNL